MSGWERTFWKAVLCYLVASIGCILYLLWPNYEGHAHVPFSSFPSFLLLAPLSPYFALTGFKSDPGESAGALAVFFVVFIAAFFGISRVARLSNSAVDP